MTVSVVRCPDCDAVINLPPGARSGDLIECPNCAGHDLRVRGDEGHWAATLAHRVSCPKCNESIALPEDVKPGDVVSCCGRSYRLSFEYGAFAAEEA